MNLKDSFLNKSIQKIRLDDIQAKETFFQEELNTDDRLAEFNQKYLVFRDNYIDIKQNKTKAEQVDNQYKLIQQISPGLMMEDVTATLLSQVTLLYISEIIEEAKVISMKNENQRITPLDIQDAVRIQDLKNPSLLKYDLEKFFD